MKLYFIRHGLTQGNQSGRYIGKTDEPLCEDGILQLQNHSYEPVPLVVCSPMTRCRQTADYIYPKTERVFYSGLVECDFGEFEGKNYKELDGNENYQRWIDSNATLPFPGGEDPKAFRLRSVQAFLQAVEEHREREALAFVVHGGTIMAILEALAWPKRDFYDWHVKNGEGYGAEYDPVAQKIQILEKIV